MFHIILSLLTLINALLQTEAQVFLPAQIVLPTNRGDTQQTAQTYKDLQDIVGSTNVVQIMSHTFKPPGIVEVWRLIGDDRAIRRVKRLPGVKYVGDDGPCMNETGLYSRSGTESKVRARAGNVRSQPLRKRTPPVRVIDGNAPWNLKFMSWAPNTMFNNLLGYKYLQADLSDPSYVKSFIYVIENGVDPQTNEFPDAQEWLFTTRASTARVDDSTNGHGTCVASLAVGVHYGVAKQSQLIVAKAGLDDTELIEIWAKIQNDILTKGRQGRSVVLFARTADPAVPVEIPQREVWEQTKIIMEELIADDVIIVTGSGNEGEIWDEITAWPALWAKDEPDFHLIVAGAVNQDGTTADVSQGPVGVTAWAPGHEVLCAAVGGAGQQVIATGTSFAVPHIGGLLAYYLALRNTNPTFAIGGGATAQSAAAFLQQRSSWQHSPAGEQHVVWNLEDATVPA